MRSLRILPALLMLIGGVASASPALTNVTVVNVTASTFSLVWVSTPGAVPAISIYADPSGATNLAGQVGVEFYPLHTGSPDSSDAYQRRLSEQALRQKTAAQGLVEVRVSHCKPNTTYYFQLHETAPLGAQSDWPASGPLPSATTSVETAYVIQSRQLAFSLPGLDPSGTIVLLSNSNTPSVLAAVAGDGISSNQVYFSLTDLLAASGNTNYLPLGNQTFTATVMDGTSNAPSQTYAVNFNTDFLVGQGGLVALGDYAALTLGSGIVRAGDSGSVPISVNASAITSVSFSLHLPTARFSNLSVQPTSPQVGSAQIQLVSSDTYLLTLTAAGGQTLLGDQQIALLNYATVSNQASAFVPLSPLTFQATNGDGSTVANLAVGAGRLAIVNHQPLLEDLVDSNGGRDLALYGLPGFSYEIQRSDTAGNPPWLDLIRVPMASLVEVFHGMDTNRAAVAYRALEFTADPPLIEAHLATQNRSLTVYGIPGTNYVVQYATNLSDVVSWYPLLSCTLTNSFQLISNLGATNPVIFYRVAKP